MLQWSCLSDRIGRRPILLFNLLGTIVLSIFFGLPPVRSGRSSSRSTFSCSRAVAADRLGGLVGGNLGVIRYDSGAHG